jgi:hypothetical protein
MIGSAARQQAKNRIINRKERIERKNSQNGGARLIAPSLLDREQEDKR